jgi:hypothetical protein
MPERRTFLVTLMTLSLLVSNVIVLDHAGEHPNIEPETCVLCVHAAGCDIDLTPPHGELIFSRSAILSYTDQTSGTVAFPPFFIHASRAPPFIN